MHTDGSKQLIKGRNIMGDKKKKGLFEVLFGSKKGSCCDNFELEEIPEEKATNKDSEKSDDSVVLDKKRRTK